MMQNKIDGLARLVAEIRACRICAAELEPRPVLHVSIKAKILVASQAPGLRVHLSGQSFDDTSGDRLRDWMGVTRDEFYDDRRVALAGMAFCFPGYDASGSDRPPPPICAAHWRTRLMAALPNIELILLAGSFAQSWHLGKSAKSNMTETVRAWREYSPRHIPLPHPSWRNNGWLKNNSWFERDLLPVLRRRVRRLLSS
jgi:uracil-DNA glycosylase